MVDSRYEHAAALVDSSISVTLNMQEGSLDIIKDMGGGSTW